MGKIVLPNVKHTDAQKIEIKKIEHSAEYEELVREANQEIEKGRNRERKAWINSQKY